jgi:thiol-disulfide isomerase/thioredoxin
MLMNILRNLALYKKFLVILFITAIFIVVAVYVYKKYVVTGSRIISKNQKLNNDYGVSDTSESSSGNESSINYSTEDKLAELYLFYTDWCPHCKKAKPEWEKLKNNYSNNKKINGYTLQFIEVDCEANPDLGNKFNVTGYPTIKLVKGNQVIEFDAKPEVSMLENFLATVLSK